MLHLSLARSTRQSYHTGIKRFIRFCKTQHVRPLPATSRTVTYFATALHKQRMAPATIRLYLSAVSACHRENGFADPCKDNPLLTLVKRGVTRSSKRLPDQRQPITSTILRHLIHQLKSDQHLRKPDRAMLSAAFCLAFYGLLRVSEYTAPSDKAFISRVHATLSDIQWHSQHFTFILKRSKTDQQGKGTMISFCKLTKSTCPYHSMATYIALAPPKDPHTTPLFCFSNGRPLTRFRLLKHLRRQLQRAGYHPHRFNTHSFRIGGATSAAEACASQATIQQLGRWRSQAYRRYIHPPQKAPSLRKPKATAGSTSASSMNTRTDSRPHGRWQHQ